MSAFFPIKYFGKELLGKRIVDVVKLHPQYFPIGFFPTQFFRELRETVTTNITPTPPPIVILSNRRLRGFFYY
jgi:hypothetical protein